MRATPPPPSSLLTAFINAPKTPNPWTLQGISDLIELCLLPDPSHRPSAEEVFRLIDADQRAEHRTPPLAQDGTPHVITSCQSRTTDSRAQQKPVPYSMWPLPAPSSWPGAFTQQESAPHRPHFFSAFSAPPQAATAQQTWPHSPQLFSAHSAERGAVRGQRASDRRADQAIGILDRRADQAIGIIDRRANQIGR